MSMPPAGMVGAMDEDAVIQAEINLELDNINLDDDADNIDLDDGLDGGEDMSDDQEDVQGIPEELDNYIKHLQEQTSNFERELEECDELIAHTDRHKHNGTSDAVIPYEDFNLLSQLAKERGCDVDQYKQQILLELEQDEDILHDDLADLLTEDAGDLHPSGHSKCLAEVDPTASEKRPLLEAGDPSLPVAIERAVEQGIDPTEVPVSQELVPLNNRAGIQQMLKEQLVRLENTYRKRTQRIKQEEAMKREMEEARQRQAEEERQYKKQEIEKQEQKLMAEREVVERQIKMEEEEAERQIAEQMKIFKDEMRVLEVETERQKAELAKARMDEEIRKIDKQHHSALTIQRSYRGYRTRKQYLPVLEERREERRRVKEECRIKEVEKEIEDRERKKAQEEEQKRLKLEEEKRKKEEEKQRKEEEKRLKEEEKQRKKEEEERKKEEEKQRKEEEKRRKEEEKQKNENEKRRKEGDKRKKEEEAERKREEKRMKEEEEKRRKEEERLKKEEEKRKREEEKLLKEQEKKNIEEKQKPKEECQRNCVGESQDTKLKEKSEQVLSTDLANNINSTDSNKAIECDKRDKVMRHNIGKSADLPVMKKDDSVENIESEINKGSHNNLRNGFHSSDNMKEGKQDITKSKNSNEARDFVSKSGKLEEIIGNVDRIEKDLAARAKLGSSNELQEVRSPRIPHPPLSPKKKQQDHNKDVRKSVEKSSTDKPPSVDCLPQHLEDKRINFIKQCLPWSKISNEPWKLKGVTSKKPLRRPSSAKKLSPLPEDVIVKAARVASLKQVTTVELHDLPGYSMSPLGQCWGLKYLSLVRCNLRLLEGLQQCKQLLYIDVKDNKLEYIDLKDIGSLQVLDMSNNGLTSVHGLDNCTNLRWLDISHNNITRLGGLETLRRLHTLKLSRNQLISTAGLGDTPTLQVLDISANHLQAVEDTEKLCLLLSLDVSANNILKIPSLKNQVLLRELLLTDNSITSLEQLSTAWLPLCHRVNVSQNNLMEPESLESCLTLRDLDISGNQILDAELVKKCIQACSYIEQLSLEENPFIEDIDNSFYEDLHKLLPRLQGSNSKPRAVKPRCSYEAMCLSQARTYTDLFRQQEENIRNLSDSSSDLAHKCDSYFKFCDKTFQIAVEHRYAHEYGEVPVTIPTAPITPRSGRPNTARKIVPKVDTLSNPKDLFDKALQSSNAASTVNSSSVIRQDSANKTAKPVVTSATTYSNPKDLFEQALKSSATNSTSSNSGIVNGISPVQDLSKRQDRETAAATKIQAAWRGWSVRRDISQHTKIWSAAVTIQTAWRGYRVRQWYRSTLEERRNIDPELVEKLHTAATTIQAAWRGYWLRSKLLAALEYARFEDDDEDDEDAMNLNGDDFDVDKFMDFNEDLLDTDWRPPSTPEIPANHPVLRKPPSGRAKIPPISTVDRPPSNPRRAWKNLESPMSDSQGPLGRIPRPPSSVSSGADTHRTGLSKKEEKLSEEWGFKDSSTAHLMMQRAKKMKYNAERKKKISKLDPKQRLRLFQKLQEDAHINQPLHLPQRKTLLPRKEYFKAQQDEMVRKEQEKQEEYKSRASRIYEWLHMPVNNYPVTDSVINKGLNQGIGQRFASESNLPDVQMGKRVQLTSGPGSLELQSVDSMSNAGDQRRRFSAGSGSSILNKLPPIQSSSAPTAKTKERMSWRNPKVNQSVGWGGGKKRGNVL